MQRGRIKMRLTKEAISRRAGVSRTSVSLVLNGMPNNLSQDTQTRIINAARDLRYLPKNSLQTKINLSAVDHSSTEGENLRLAGTLSSPIKLKTIELACWGSPNILEKLTQLTADFERSFTETHVEILYMTRHYLRRLKQQFRDGQPPDIFWFKEGFMQFINRGWLLDLQPLIQKDKDFQPSNFWPDLLENFKHKGGIYSIPKDISVTVLYYNKDLLHQSGVDYPDEGWNWNDFLEACQRSTLSEKDQFGYSYSGPWFHWAWQNGGEILSQDRKECLLDEPETMEALKFLRDLRFKHGVVYPEVLFNASVAIELFMRGKVAMVTLPRYAVIPFRHINQFDWDVAPLPQGRAGLFTTVVPGGVCIAKSTNYPEEAWNLVKQMTSTKWQEEIWGLLGESMPANRFAKIKQIDDIFLQPQNQDVFTDSLEYGRVAPYFHHIHEEQLKKSLDEVIATTISSPTAVEDNCVRMKKKIREVLREESAL